MELQVTVCSTQADVNWLIWALDTIPLDMKSADGKSYVRSSEDFLLVIPRKPMQPPVRTVLYLVRFMYSAHAILTFESDQDHELAIWQARLQNAIDSPMNRCRRIAKRAQEQRYPARYGSYYGLMIPVRLANMLQRRECKYRRWHELFNDKAEAKFRLIFGNGVTETKLLFAPTL